MKEGRQRPMIAVRRAVEADLGAICEVHPRAIREVCSSHHAPAEIEAWAGRLFPGVHGESIRSREFFVAVEGSSTLGFGQLNLATAEVQGVYVHPAAVRRGVGSLLVAELERRARSAGLQRLHLDASLNSVSFYRYAGFQIDGDTKHAFGEIAIACVRMSKELRA